MKILVARISKPRGFKGELAVIPYKPDTDSLRVGLNVTLLKGEMTLQTGIEAVTYLRGRLALKMAGIESEEAALAWQGGEIVAESDDLAELERDEYYHFDIEGCEVFEEGGSHIGRVKAVDFASANDILTVESELGEILIPFVKAVVQSVDVKSKKIIIRKVEGLY